MYNFSNNNNNNNISVENIENGCSLVPCIINIYTIGARALLSLETVDDCNSLERRVMCTAHLQRIKTHKWNRKCINHFTS